MSTAKLGAEADAEHVLHLHSMKQQLKASMKQWEREWEKLHGGLVPTHHDKKEDLRYRGLKEKALRCEAELDQARTELKAVQRSQLAELERSEAVSKLRGDEASRPMPTSEATFVPNAPVDDGHTAFYDEQGSRVSACYVLLLFILNAVPYAGFVGCFSLLGYGAKIYRDIFTSHAENYAAYAGSAVMILPTLYIIDAFAWKAPAAVQVRRFALLVAGVGIGVAALLCTAEYPYAPMLLLFILAPGYWWLLSRLLGLPSRRFLLTLCLSIVLLSCTAVSVWITWIYAFDNMWSTENKARYMEAMPCSSCECVSSSSLPPPPSLPPSLPSANASAAAQLKTEPEVCLRVFIYWAAPFITAVTGFVAALLCFMLSEDDSRNGIRAGPRLFIGTLAFAFLSMWVASSIAGSSMQLSRVLYSASFVVVLATGLVVERFYGWRQMLRLIMVKQPLARKLLRFCFYSDWTKALGLLVFSPLSLGWLVLSATKQFVSVHFNKSVARKERKLLLTKTTTDVLVRMRAWNWTSVLTKVIILGLAVVLLIVGVGKAKLHAKKKAALEAKPQTTKASHDESCTRIKSCKRNKNCT